MFSAHEQPVLVLGGGINGAAVARELLLNRVPVCLVDRADIACGATAASSRLVHGGLRYLEYADFRLVHESLAERERLLRLAPQFVRPLELFIPVERRISGVLASTAKFFRSRLAAILQPVPRGLWLVRTGLSLYDMFAKGSRMPKHRVFSVGHPETPPVDRHRYRWLCSYYDAQMEFPERFVVALLRDAEQLAREHGVGFQVITYHEAHLQGDVVEIHPSGGERHRESDRSPIRLQPAMIVNATGAWVDYALKQLKVASPQLMGGTKGSHFLTSHRALRHALNQRAIYAEAADGRPVFLLPFGPFSLVGTTDLPMHDDPATAVADERELEYLADAVNTVFPDVAMTRDDIDFHYSGVRPLPFRGSANPASVTRRHVLEEHQPSDIPLLSLVGGKLTSCRELAQETAALVLRRLDRSVSADSRNRFIPGGESYPEDEIQVEAVQTDLAKRLDLTLAQIRAVWRLCGTLTESMLAGNGPEPLSEVDKTSLPGTNLPLAFVKQSIRHEWCTRLTDLAERRLMLLYEPQLTVACLRQVARLMVNAGTLAEQDVETEVDRCRQRLLSQFGRQVAALT